MKPKTLHNSFNDIIKRRSIAAWCLYDWANSAFPTIVTTFIFATYYTSTVAANTVMGTAHWGYAIAIAGIIVAISSPILGAIADFGGYRKRWLALFTFIMVVACASLWFVAPDPHYSFRMLVTVVIATVGFEIGTVFYNALLIHIAPKGYIGRISGWGWGVGYFGGLVSLIVCLQGFVQAQPQWLNHIPMGSIRICGPLLAVWISVFVIPLFIWVPTVGSTGLSWRESTSKGLNQLWKTLKSLRQSKNILKFLIARMLYSDGINTVFIFGGIYAAGTFHMTMVQVIQFGIGLNVTAGIGALVMAWLDDYAGSKITITFSVIALMICVSFLLSVHSQQWFWFFALVMGLFVGPAQAASRSLMARLAPPDKSNEMFGLFALSGKITTYLGPWLVGLVTVLSGSQRIGIAMVLPFLLLGVLLLQTVKES